jgi:hypothetical protein
MEMNTRAWVEGIGLVALVLSLVFVGFELRQSSEIATVEASQGLAQMSQDLTIANFEPALAAMFIKVDKEGIDSLSALEGLYFRDFARLLFNIWEQAFYSHSRGVLNEEQWQNLHAANCDRVPVVFFEAFDKVGYLPEFVELVSECYAQAKKSGRQDWTFDPL